MSLFFFTLTSALYIACSEPRLAKWREKEGLIKFIMNCRVHKGERGRVCSNVRRRHGALSNFHTPRRPFFIHFNLAPFRNHFQDRSLLADVTLFPPSVPFLRAGHFDTRVSRRRSHRSTRSLFYKGQAIRDSLVRDQSFLPKSLSKMYNEK